VKLIREAIDTLLEKYNIHKRRKILNKAAGIWKERDDLPDFNTSENPWIGAFNGFRENPGVYRYFDRFSSGVARCG